MTRKTNGPELPLQAIQKKPLNRKEIDTIMTQSIDRFTAPPTAVPCPDWCTMPDGHGYEVEDEHDHPGRYHTFRPQVDINKNAYADLSVEAYWVGEGEMHRSPHISVVIGGDAHDHIIESPAEARDLAMTLLVVADKLEAIQ